MTHISRDSEHGARSWERVSQRARGQRETPHRHEVRRGLGEEKIGPSREIANVVASSEWGNMLPLVLGAPLHLSGPSVKQPMACRAEGRTSLEM